MAHADWIIDLGPGAGHDGGRIVFEGTPADLVAAALHPHRRAPRGLRRRLRSEGYHRGELPTGRWVAIGVVLAAQAHLVLAPPAEQAGTAAVSGG